MASEHDSDYDHESEKKVEESDASIKKMYSTIINTSPYYLSPSDNPGTPFMVAMLKGNNYRNWACSMRTTLHKKKQVRFHRYNNQETYE